MSHRTDSEGAREAEVRAGEAAGGTEARGSAAAGKGQLEEGAGAQGDLDFEALDLSIETVEERISPSETNVFDK